MKKGKKNNKDGIIIASSLAFVFFGLCFIFFVPIRTGEMTNDSKKIREGECLPMPGCEDVCPTMCYGHVRKTIFQMILDGNKKWLFVRLINEE